MKNNFSKKTYELFDLGGWCPSWETGISNADCLHHIFGRESDSPYNAAPLNNFLDHQPEGRSNLPAIHSEEVRKKYLQRTKKYLDRIGYQPTKNDLEFLNKYHEYYK